MNQRPNFATLAEHADSWINVIDVDSTSQQRRVPSERLYSSDASYPWYHAVVSWEKGVDILSLKYHILRINDTFFLK